MTNGKGVRNRPTIFLGFRAEEKAIRSAQDHAAKVFAILEKLEAAVIHAVRGEGEARDRTCKEIGKLEMEADQLRRTMLLDLSRSTLEAADRENLVRMAKALDRVADWAHDAARLLSLVPLDTFTNECKRLVTQFAGILARCGRGLQGTIDAMARDLEEAARMGDLVEAAEEEADELYIKALSILPECGKSHSAAVVVITRDLLHTFENTADAAEDAVDELRIIMLRHG